MLSLLVHLSLFLIVYAYFGYPCLLWLALKMGKGVVLAAPAANSPLPALTLIITARNEQQHIRQKLEATLALPYGEETSKLSRLQILVASDASDDETDNIVREFASRGVGLVRLSERGGKEKAQGLAVQQASGEIILFTDVKIQLNPESLENVVRYFDDPSVGAVSSIDKLEGESGEGFYVRYEMALRRLETAFSSLVGLSGSCFAVRRSVCSEWRTDIPSDFALLLACRKQGMRGVQAEDVIGYYRSVKTEEEEFERKVRTVLRGITTLFARAEVMNPNVDGVFAWQIVSHKLGRWLVPWCFLLFGFGSLVLAAGSAWHALLALSFIAFVGLAALGYFDKTYREQLYCKIPLFFILSNVAVGLAWIQYFTGKRAVLWTPSQKTSST